MRKTVKIKDVPVNTEFYTCNTKYLRRRLLHSSCHQRINGACIGVGIDGANKDCCTLFLDDYEVEIDVPKVKFKDIGTGEFFKYNGNEYQKLYLNGHSHLAKKDIYLYEFCPEKEVERE